MGNTNFNLERAIDDHLRHIKAKGSLTEVDVKELNAHLSDATGHLQNLGLNGEEAFFIACKRLGTEEVITQEYSKVNPSLNVNKIWAYLLLGFNFLYAIPSLIILIVGIIYLVVYAQYGISSTSTIIITAVNLLFIAGVFSLVKQKQHIANFIETQVKINPFRIVAFSFIPTLLHMLYYYIIYGRPGDPILKVSYYQVMYNPFTEFTFYLAIFSIVFAVLGLVFSTTNIGKLNLKMLFEKPSIFFLLCFGFITEMLAASTRSVTRFSEPSGIVTSALIFGIIYFIMAFPIPYYNKISPIKHIVIFSIFGFIAELGAGIPADIGRGGTHFTAYYVLSLLVGMLGGSLLGFTLKRRRASDQYLLS